MKRSAIAALLLAGIAISWLPQAGAQGLRERMQQAREASRQERPVAVPAGGTAIRNIAYGPDPAQRFDLYLPANASRAPVVFYVHGGGWANGDKTNPGLASKLAKRAEALRVPMRVQPEPMDHGEINKELGLRSDYTARVGAWIDRLTGVAGRR